MSLPASHVWKDPAVLRVDWLEHAMLVHAITLTGRPRSTAVHWLFGGALVTGALGTGAIGAGQLAVAGLLGVAWAGFAGGLGVEAWKVYRAAPPVRRRILVELRAEQLAWTVLEGDRWSMQHQHELPLPTLSAARRTASGSGPEVALALHDGTERRIPLHGLPEDDAGWLADRIGEAIDAVADAAIDDESPPASPG